MFRHTTTLALIASLVTMPAFAGTQTGQVTQITTRASDGLIWFFLNGSATGRPSCASGTTYWMIKDENSATGKRQLAMLLTARVTGQAVTVVGAGTCSRWGDGEDVNSIDL